jgi:thioredoxin reductase
LKIGESVSVLGCGISGLMTAIACVRKGLKVSVYAARIPKPNETNPRSYITSEIAPGFWFSSFYDYQDQKIHEERCLFSYNKYMQWMRRVKSIRKVPVYDTFTTD